MANNFMQGMQMSMQMARDIRSANLAQADRAERRKYRKKADERADEELALRKKSEKRQSRESKTRITSLKQGMKRAKRGESRDMAVDSAKLLNENLQRQIIQKKLEDSRNPAITAFKYNRGLLEEYQKTVNAADQRHAVQMGPLLKSMEQHSGTWEEYAHKEAMRDKMLADHKDFKAGLEQSFMSASNQPHEGKWSIRPYFNEFTNSMSYGAMFEGGSASEAKAAFESIKSMGGNVGISAGATPATPAPSADPNNPLALTLPSNRRINRDAP